MPVALGGTLLSVSGGISLGDTIVHYPPDPIPDPPIVSTATIDPASAPIVTGSTLEFHDAMVGGGLKMVNPQATHECACGDSFSV